MTFGMRSLLGVAGFTLCVLAAVAPAQSACSSADASGMIAVPMHKAADHVRDDPAGIWSRWDMWNPSTPAATTIWTGSASSCGGQVIVSQIVNRQCSSAVECPARVVLQAGNDRHVLLSYKQICTVHQTFQLHGDLSALDACGQSIPLRAPSR